jgi:hypothetical protein
MQPFKLVKPAVAATILDRSVSTLAKDRMKGTGCPYIKDGGAVRYDLRVLEEYAARRTRRSTSDTGVHERCTYQMRRGPPLVISGKRPSKVSLLGGCDTHRLAPNSPGSKSLWSARIADRSAALAHC